MKKSLNILLKIGGGLILIALMLITVTSISPIYDFQQPTPFSGKDIFNPYRNFDIKSG